jgi:hypothetical protein
MDLISTKRKLILEGASLMSDAGENQEYDRAIVELVSYTLGLSSDDFPVVETFLKALRV